MRQKKIKAKINKIKATILLKIRVNKRAFILFLYADLSLEKLYQYSRLLEAPFFFQHGHETIHFKSRITSTIDALYRIFEVKNFEINS